MDPVAGTVLTVCTANVCRSPLAEEVLQHALLGVDVGSAGVRAMVGAPMCALSAELLPVHGAPAAAHRARAVTREQIERADLVLAMEREQRSALVRTAPGSQAKVFTLREAVVFAEALRERGQAGLGDVAALAAAMHGLRGIVTPPLAPEAKRRWFRPAAKPADPLTIADGHGLDEATHRAAAEEVRSMSDRFAAAVQALLPL